MIRSVPVTDGGEEHDGVHEPVEGRPRLRPLGLQRLPVRVAIRAVTPGEGDAVPDLRRADVEVPDLSRGRTRRVRLVIERNGGSGLSDRRIDVEEPAGSVLGESVQDPVADKVGSGGPIDGQGRSVGVDVGEVDDASRPGLARP